jgi:rhodanese-related sulfurtransferase
MSKQLKKNDPTQALEFFEHKMQFTTGPVELNEQIENHADLLVVDVRAAKDFAEGHIPGAINLPREQWSAAPGALSQERLNVLCCYSHVCHLAAAAAVEFAGQGYSVMEMDGGFKAWKENNLEVEHGAPVRSPESSKAMSA